MFKWLWNFLSGKISIFSFNVDEDESDTKSENKITSKIIDLLKQSVINEGQFSSTRIQAFMTMLLVYIFAFIYVIIEMMNAYHMWPKTYIPTTESIIVFSMILAHHLGILFHKVRENKYSKNQIEKDKKKLSID